MTEPSQQVNNAQTQPALQALAALETARSLISRLRRSGETSAGYVDWKPELDLAVSERLYEENKFSHSINVSNTITLRLAYLNKSQQQRDKETLEGVYEFAQYMRGGKTESALEHAPAHPGTAATPTVRRRKKMFNNESLDPQDAFESVRSERRRLFRYEHEHEMSGRKVRQLSIACTMALLCYIASASIFSVEVTLAVTLLGEIAGMMLADFTMKPLIPSVSDKAWLTEYMSLHGQRLWDNLLKIKLSTDEVARLNYIRLNHAIDDVILRQDLALVMDTVALSELDLKVYRMLWTYISYFGEAVGVQSAGISVYSEPLFGLRKSMFA